MSKDGRCCPRCGVIPSKLNRIITDNCGHDKCRSCFLQDEEECLECKQSSMTIPSTSVNTGIEVKTKKLKSLNVSNSEKSTHPQHLFSHIERETTEEGSIRFHCTVCGKSFNSRSQRYYHAVCGNSEAAKKYKCEQCEKCFGSRSHLNYHLESHTIQTFACMQCGKSFNKRAVLKKHQKLHEPLTKSKCVECGKVFKCKQNLKAHLEQHRNILRFECVICEKKYALKSTLQQHMLKHSARKHKCNECGKQFQRNSSLKLHLKRHRKTESFDCKKCFKQFSDIGALLRHEKLHEDSIRYKCTQCDIITKRKDNMIRHVRNIHMENDFQNCFEIVKPSGQEPLEDPIINTTIIKDTSIIVESVVTNDASASNADPLCNLPKTVQYSSVIKCIGNVEPVIIPNAQQDQAAVVVHETALLKVDNTNACCTFTTLENACSNIIAPKEAVFTTKKRQKKRYDPIEMYRKILISEDEAEVDNNESDEDNAIEEESTVTEKHATQQQRATIHNASNFSETHWRKNFKYTYEYQEY